MMSSAVFVGAVQTAKKLPDDVIKALTEGKDFAVMSIDPDGIEAVPTDAWKVLARNTIDNAAVRKEVVDAVKKSVEEGRSPAFCFHPRHAISTTHGKKKYVLVICFQCSVLQIYAGGEQKDWFAISNHAKAVLDKILDGAGTKTVGRDE